MSGDVAPNQRYVGWAATLLVVPLVLITVLVLPTVRPPAGTRQRMH